MSTAEEAPQSSALRWYLKIGDQNHGPYTREEVARYLGEGRISAYSLMAREGSDDWQAARDDPELAGLFAGGTTPPPHTAPAHPTLPELRTGTQTHDPLWAHVTYGLYASLLLAGLSAPLMLVGVVIAHVQREDTRGSWLESHYLWQIRTFWIALPFFLVGIFTIFFLIGFLFLGFVWCWVIYRAVKGWLKLTKEQPIEEPTSFF